MFELEIDTSSKPTMYADLVSAAHGLTDGERDPIANMANISALLWQSLPKLNWTGFYRYDSAELVLGPFQGKPACIRIPMGQGVCGAAAAERVTQRVPDVHAFPGHIACDAASQSEIVVPVIHEGQLVGVLDLDSPVLARFDEEDARGLEALIAKIAPRLTSSGGGQT
jgi:GAF domain-containing protein